MSDAVSETHTWRITVALLSPTAGRRETQLKRDAKRVLSFRRTKLDARAPVRVILTGQLAGPES